MTLHPDLEALIQGALDDTLTLEERERLDRLMTESVEARDRAAHLKELTDLLDSLGPSEPPAGLVQNVLAEISEATRAQSADAPSSAVPRHGVAAFPIIDRPSIRHSAHTRAIAGNKKIMFGLAAAAALVLAVIRFTGNSTGPEGAEATIGAARRAESPQIEAKDVALGDTTAQGILQTETWDQIVRDDALRTALQDPDIRSMLQDHELRQALADADVLRMLRDPDLKRKLNDAGLVRALSDGELATRFDDANLRNALRNRAFVNALRNAEFRRKLIDMDLAAALARPAFQIALRDRGFDAALRNPNFGDANFRDFTIPK